jgi:gamma-glutamyl:cysteine ligase YbdK (ATP-grasp superfamily)
MPLEEFKSSQPLTMGVELELQLVSLSDFDLTASSPDLLHLLARKPFPGHVTPEITESMIEINSDVHTKHGELLAQLRETRDTLVRAADTLNIGICGGGTHLPALGGAQDLFQAALQGSVGVVWLPGQAVHDFRPARAHRLRQR